MAEYATRLRKLSESMLLVKVMVYWENAATSYFVRKLYIKHSEIIFPFDR